jgi:hypothetical protein
MATDLRDRLGDLASHAPPGSPPADLWQRGVRRRRLARAGMAAMVVALVALLGVGGWSWRDHARVEPVAPQGAPHLPDRFYDPSPWLPSFDDPPGPLVAVGMARRKSLLHSWTDLYGVTASGGRYGFLGVSGLADLAGAGATAPPVLYRTGGRSLSGSPAFRPARPTPS